MMLGSITRVTFKQISGVIHEDNNLSPGRQLLEQNTGAKTSRCCRLFIRNAPTGSAFRLPEGSVLEIQHIIWLQNKRV